MHSRVFAIVGCQEAEIFERDENEVYDHMEHIADYVKDTELFESWQWLIKSCYGKVIKGECKDHKYFIKINFKELKNYFSDKLDKLRNMLDDMNVDEFADSWSMKCYEFECEQNDKFGFYVFDTCEQYFSVDTIDEWLKYVYTHMKRSNKTTVKYQVLKAYDYHS